MTGSDKERLERIGFRVEKSKDDSRLKIKTPETTVERIDSFADEYDFGSRSSAIRHLLGIGLKSAVMNDPRTSVRTGTEDNDGDSGSIQLKDFVPAGRENAVDLRDELIEKIDEELLDAVQADPDIEMDGWEVYRDEG